MTKPEQAGVREKLLDELFKLYGVNQRGEHYTFEESDQYEKVADELLSLVEATCLEVISLPKAQQRQALSKLLGRGEEG